MKRNIVTEVILCINTNKWTENFFYLFSIKLIIIILFLFLFNGKMGAQSFVKIPLKLIGQTIFFEATVDGHDGNFILDTGSPGMILNNRLFAGHESLFSDGLIVDMSGEKNRSLFYQVKEAAIASYQLPNELARVTDLSGIEAMKGISVAGIIGFRSFKKTELILDIEQRLLIINQQKNNDETAAEKFGYFKTDSLSFQLNGHIPYVHGFLKDKPILLGIDTGSEINILHLGNLKGQTSLFKAMGRVLMQGVGTAPEKRAYGQVDSIVINGKQQKLEAALVDLISFNKTRVVPLDGILGTPYFHSSVVVINYRKKKLYFLERPEIMLATEEEAIINTTVATPLQNK